MKTNEMIWKTLTTKVGKEPKFRSILVDMGIEIYDSECSEQGFWAVRDTATGRNLVISKDYDGKRTLYGNDGCWDVETKNVRLVDYIGYLRCQREYKNYYDLHPEYNSEYRKLRHRISTEKDSASLWSWELKKIDKKIADLMEERERYAGYYKKSCDGLREVRQRVEELRRQNV